MNTEHVMALLCAQPGLTATHLLTWAEGADRRAAHYRDTGQDHLAQEAIALARAMRAEAATGRWPHPPKIPTNAEEAL